MLNKEVERSLKYVSNILKIDTETILSKSRDKRAIRARVVISRHLRQNRNYSYPRIARIFGMHHSTIIHYMKGFIK